MTKEKNKTYKQGERIITRGQAARTAFLVLKGRVAVTLERDGRQVTLGELGGGAIFGETALFGKGAVYGADVDAVQDTELALITPESFAGKIEACDPMLRAILEMLMERLRKTNEALLNSETREFMDIAFV
jgi:CRP-like cAMP-binding protein